MRNVFRALVVVIGLLWTQSAQADPLLLLLETDADESSGDELFLATYDTLVDFMDANLASGSYSDVGISPGFSVRGFVFDGSKFRLLLESDADESAGDELFVASYNSLADFMDGNLAGASFSDVGISPGFSVGGFAFDGSRYHLLLESDADESAGDELFVASYDSLADFMDSNLAFGGFSDVGISPGFSVGGFTYDAGFFRLLLESNADESPGDELFVASYASLADFMAANLAGGSFSDVNISPGFSAVGFLAMPTPPPPVPVPEPSTVVMLVSAVVAAGIRRRRSG